MSTIADTLTPATRADLRRIASDALDRASHSTTVRDGRSFNVATLPDAGREAMGRVADAHGRADGGIRKDRNRRSGATKAAALGADADTVVADVDTSADGAIGVDVDKTDRAGIVDAPGDRTYRRSADRRSTAWRDSRSGTRDQVRAVREATAREARLTVQAADLRRRAALAEGFAWIDLSPYVRDADTYAGRRGADCLDADGWASRAPFALALADTLRERADLADLNARQARFHAEQAALAAEGDADAQAKRDRIREQTRKRVAALRARKREAAGR